MPVDDGRGRKRTAETTSGTGVSTAAGKKGMYRRTYNLLQPFTRCSVATKREPAQGNGMAARGREGNGGCGKRNERDERIEGSVRQG